MEKLPRSTPEQWNMGDDTEETLSLPNMEQENSSKIEQLKAEIEQLRAENNQLKFALLAATQNPGEFRSYGANHLTKEQVESLAKEGEKDNKKYIDWRKEEMFKAGVPTKDQPTDAQISLIHL